jgi:hypothetical protein
VAPTAVLLKLSMVTDGGIKEGIMKSWQVFLETGRKTVLSFTKCSSEKLSFSSIHTPTVFILHVRTCLNCCGFPIKKGNNGPRRPNRPYSPGRGGSRAQGRWA